MCQVSNIRLRPRPKRYIGVAQGLAERRLHSDIGADVMNEDQVEETSGSLSMLASVGASMKSKLGAFSDSTASLAGRALVAVGDANGDGKVDASDAGIILSGAAEGVGNVAKAVARAPLTKDVATYAAVGAVVALPLPIVGSAIGAAVGAGLGLWRNMTRHETLTPVLPDPLAEIERLHGLHERGAITDDEFSAWKAKLLK